MEKLRILTNNYNKINYKIGFRNITKHSEINFEPDKNISNQYQRITDKNASFPGYGGLPVFYQPTTNSMKKILTTSVQKILLQETHANTNNGYYYIDQSTVNSIIVGVTRSGKGEKFILPLLKNLTRGQKKATVIVHDPKGELLSKSGKSFEDAGYEIYTLKPTDSEYSSRWNIFMGAYIALVNNNIDSFEIELQNLVDIFVPKEGSRNDPYWSDSARIAFSAVLRNFLITRFYELDPDIIAIKKSSQPPKFKDFCDYLDLCITLSNNRKSNLPLSDLAIDSHNSYEYLVNEIPDLQRIEPVLFSKDIIKFIDNCNKASIDIKDTIWFKQLLKAQLDWESAQPSATRTRACINSFITSSFKLIETSSIFDITNENEINYQNLLLKPSVVFLQSSTLAPVTNSFLTLFIDQFYRFIFENGKKNNTTKAQRRVHFVIDELPLLPAIPELDLKLASGLGHEILFDLAIQNYDQLNSKYPKTANNILGNCSNIALIKGDGNTVKYLEERSGGLLNSKLLTYMPENTYTLFRSLTPQSVIGNNAIPLPIQCKWMPFDWMNSEASLYTATPHNKPSVNIDITDIVNNSLKKTYPTPFNPFFSSNVFEEPEELDEFDELEELQ